MLGHIGTAIAGFSNFCASCENFSFARQFFSREGMPYSWAINENEVNNNRPVSSLVGRVSTSCTLLRKVVLFLRG